MKPVRQNLHKRNFILQKTPFKIHLCKTRANNRKKAFPGRKTLYPECAECTCNISSKGLTCFILFFCKIRLLCFILKESYLIRCRCCDSIKAPRQKNAFFSSFVFSKLLKKITLRKKFIRGQKFR